MFYSTRPSVRRLQQHPMNLHVARYNSHKCYAFIVLMIKVHINVVTCPSKSHNIVIIFWLCFFNCIIWKCHSNLQYTLYKICHFKLSIALFHSYWYLSCELEFQIWSGNVSSASTFMPHLAFKWLKCTLTFCYYWQTTILWGEIPFIFAGQILHWWSGDIS